MPVSRRQDRLFNKVVRLYRPADPDVDVNNMLRDLGWSEPPAFVDVRAYKSTSPDTDNPSLVGATNYDIQLTVDQWKFALDQEIGVGWLFLDTTQDSEDLGQCYIVQGVGRTDSGNRRRAQQTHIYAAKTPTPAGINPA